ncbi:MAG: YggS family pyridoxal phosphate-dependent enzyme [Acetobacteraceae bacterium]|nr:YggS family pyridoxal phosphate-dependent enzyme [Acetobacteraceae bacterium]
MEGLAQNLERVREALARAAVRSGRRPEDVTLVAVTKEVQVPRILEAVALGVTDLGENRYQEAREKLGRVPGVRWHFIGHLQRNKVKYVLESFELVHSLDRAALAEEIDRHARRRGRPARVLVQVNLTGDPRRHGVLPGDLPRLLEACALLPGLRVEGLMTIAPPAPTPEGARPYFRRLFELAQEQRQRGLERVSLDHLSMGMSDDFVPAVEEGATMVRLGRALFGERRGGRP